MLARQRIGDDAGGFTTLLALLAEHGDDVEDPIPVAIETPRGLLTACLRATGRPVYPINPMAVARYRDRHSVAGRKSDHGDAVVLANILRTDSHAHRPLPADSELVQAIAVLARAQQDAVWARTTAHHKLRSHLREYYPGFLAAFADARGGITRPEARVLLAAAPDPAVAAKLTGTKLQALLKRAGRTRGIAAEAARLRDALRAPQMRQCAFAGTVPVTRASGRTHYVKARKVRNKRLGDACHWWAFAALTRSPGARAHYDRRRAAGEHHNAALRNVANKPIARMWWCLANDQPWDDQAAWPAFDTHDKPAAA